MKKIILTTILTFLFALCLTAPPSPRFYIPASKPLVKGFDHYFDDLGYEESGEDPTAINEIGCFAKHQWKETTLHYLGYTNITLRKFKRDPSIFPIETQREALKALNKSNETLLKGYQCYIGTTIDGIPVTKSGLLAAAHLAGATNVKKFLLTNGTYIIADGWEIPVATNKKKNRYNKKDMNGTSIKHYLWKFAFYDI